MSKIPREKLIASFASLGLELNQPGDDLCAVINAEHLNNPWFTSENVMRAVKNIGAGLTLTAVRHWLERYPTAEVKQKKNIGLILAGNIPLVGLHDVFCVLAAGHKALIKASAQDARLIREVLKLLETIEPAFAGRFEFVERLAGFDAVIATGSNNSSRYFEYYFGRVPHIIRKNRSSVAVLSGDETGEQLALLGHDIFDYFGLGCRNVSKLLVPEGYDFGVFFRAIESYQNVINHHKYCNNYDYNKSIYLVNCEKHLDNGFLLLKEDEGLVSPLAVLFFEYYHSKAQAVARLQHQKDNIQCVVSANEQEANIAVVGFGQSQCPALWDYADGIDTMAFLLNL